MTLTLATPLVRDLRKDFFFPLIAAFLLSCLPSWLLPGFAQAAPEQARLLEKVKVHRELVTLGDLFENAGIWAAKPVFRAPNPGTSGKISVKRILSAAKASGLRTIDPALFLTVTVSRTSRIIELEELKNLIRGKLDGRLPRSTTQGRLIIQLPMGQKDLHVDEAVRGELSLTSLDWSARTGRFTARFHLAQTDPIIMKGTASLMVEAAVAKSVIARGETITANHIEVKYIRSNKRRRGKQLAPDDLIGLSAVRRLPAGKPILRRDLQQPQIIHKNQLVTILLEVPGLVLRTQGKALADAGKGETIRILNTQSKRIIHATAIASGLVSVSLAKPVGSGS